MLSLNEHEYLSMPGLDIMLAHDFYPEGHQGGLVIRLNGQRIASNGDLRASRTPGQWDPLPSCGTRKVDRESKKISLAMAWPDPSKDRKGFNPLFYPDVNFSYTLTVEPQGDAILVKVHLDRALTEQEAQGFGFNLELFPPLFFGTSFQSSRGDHGIFPLQPNGPGVLVGESYQIAALAQGTWLSLAAETADRHIVVESLGDGDIELIDGRGHHTNGWFVLRTMLEPGIKENAIVWKISPDAIPGYTSPPVIQLSQVGYLTWQKKIAILELDEHDHSCFPVKVLRIHPRSGELLVHEALAKDWGNFLNGRYFQFDFTFVQEPGLYRLVYGTVVSQVFKIGDDVYSRHVWQPTLDTFLPVQMCHMRVMDGYRVWHGACHLDDARMAPVNHNHFDGYVQGPDTLCACKPGQEVPGLDRGGWHDAGDFDLRVESQSDTMYGLALAWECFRPDYDNTTIDQEQRLVILRKPDGKPDILQQIAHGALSLLGAWKNLGRLYRGIIEPDLMEQYVVIGDPSIQTDNKKGWYEVFGKPAPGFPPMHAFDTHSASPPGSWAVPDDRWVFTEDNPERELNVAAGLAASSRALLHFDGEMASECLLIAKTIWKKNADTHHISAFPLAVELLLCTGDDEYVQHVAGSISVIEANAERLAWLGVRALPSMDETSHGARYRSAIEVLVRKLAQEHMEQSGQNPYGVPYEPHIWGAGWNIQQFGKKQFFLHQAFPELVGPHLLFNALEFILGKHPGPHTASFVSGVGSKSVTQAYGLNRADRSCIPGGVVSGTALIRPHFPELLEWPYLWQQTEYVLGGGTSDYLFLALGADYLARKQKEEP